MIDVVKYPSAGRQAVLSPSDEMELPDFPVVSPRILNPELITDQARSAMRLAWEQGWFRGRRLEVCRLKGAFVVDEGLVFDDNLQFISNCVDYSVEKDTIRALQDIGRTLTAGGLMRYPGLTILAKKRAPNNYGHFLLEILPLAFIGRMLFGDENPTYLVHNVSPPTEDAMLRSFRLLKFGLDRLIFTGYRDPAHFEELVFFRGLTHHGSYMSSLAVQIVESMALLVPEGNQKRLFVRRIPGWAQGRMLRNEEEVYRRLAACGYEEIEPGSMSLEEQIGAFRGAERIVGVSGAAMTNIVFCKPGTKVTLLVPGAFPDTFFWFIATHKRLDYLEIRGDQTTYSGAESWKGGFSIREDDIQYLELQG